MIISEWIAGNEKIEVEKAGNGLYFINYGVGVSRAGIKYHVCFAGGFDSYEKAVETLKKHRPGVVKR